MDNPMNLKSKAYAWASSASESDITLTEGDKNLQRVIIDNQTAYPVAVTSGVSSATAEFPTSATVPVECKVVNANQCMTYTKNIGDGVISLIQENADSGKYVYVYIGSGE